MLFIWKTRGGIRPFIVPKVTIVADNAACIPQEQASSQLDCAELFITEFTPVMGVHTGPGVIGVAFYSGD